jgi:hypothetical protein
VQTNSPFVQYQSAGAFTVGGETEVEREDRDHPDFPIQDAGRFERYTYAALAAHERFDQNLTWLREKGTSDLASLLPEAENAAVVADELEVVLARIWAAAMKSEQNLGNSNRFVSSVRSGAPAVPRGCATPLRSELQPDLRLACYCYLQYCESSISAAAGVVHGLPRHSCGKYTRARRLERSQNMSDP